MKRSSTVPLLLAASITARTAAAQGLDRAPTPIEVTAEPAAAVPGASITIGGTSLELGDRKSVTITVRPPQGAPATLTAALDGQGSFRTQFTSTQSLGRYTVTAVSPDGGNRAQVSFDVLTAGAATSAGVTALKALAGKLCATTTTLEEIVAGAEASPAQQQLEQELEGAIADCTALTAALDEVERIMQPLDAIVAEFPAVLPEVQDIYFAVGQIAGEAATVGRELDVAAAAARGNRSNLCDSLDTITELLRLLSSSPLGVLKTGISKLAALASAQDSARAARMAARLLDLPEPRRVALQARFGAALAGIKGLPARAPFIAIGILEGKLTSVLALAAEGMFAAFCERFTGPVTANFTQELYQDGKKFWAYTARLEGKLTLRYRRGSGQAAIPLSGEFDGNGTKFTLWEDLTVIDPRVRRGVVARKAIAPFGFPYTDLAGRFGRAVTPASFSIPVTGTLEGQTIKLAIQPGGRDFSPAVQGKAVYIFMTPGAPIPVVSIATLPYQKAWFVIDRGTRGNPSFPVTVFAAEKYSEIKQAFTRQEQGARFKVSFRVDVRSCNPECP